MNEITEETSLFEKYITWAGGYEAAAEALKCTTQYLYLVRCGSKPMSLKLANKIYAHSGGKFKREKLLWG